MGKSKGKGKKNQHVVPRCYLAAFLSGERPLEHADNAKFERGVWTSSPSLDGWKLKAPANVLTKPYFYTVPGDDPCRPEVEEFLGRIEDRIPPLRAKLERREPLTVGDLCLTALFTMTLFQRVPRQQGVLEDFLATTVRHRQAFEQGSRADAVQLSPETVEACRAWSRRSLLATDPAAILLAEGIHFIVGHSSDLLLTGDNPVLRFWRHTDELAKFLGDASLIDPRFTRADVHPVTIAPLTPRVALLATPFLRTEYEGYPYLPSPRPTLFEGINVMTILNADKVVVSALPEPLGSREEAFRQFLLEKSQEPRADQEEVLIYTDDDRFVLPIADLLHEPMRAAFHVVGQVPQQLKIPDARFSRVGFFRGGVELGGMRNVRAEVQDSTVTLLL